MTADDLDTIKQELQNFFSDGLVTVVGSGLSCAETLPGMQELADHLLATVGPALIPADVAIWTVISAAIKANGLEAALRYVLSIGVDRIQPEVEALAGRIAEGARAKGYRLASDRRAGTTSGIVSFQKDGVDSRVVVSQLKDAGILASPRQGWVRTSPHFYLAAEEIDAVIGEL